MKIGIPAALLYYEYYPMWRAFFRELGAEVVTSAPTNRTTLADGASRVISDTCLPVKVFTGHVISLIGKCDYLFIPVVRSMQPKVYNCAKFLGLPDMTRAVVPEAPPILEIELDINLGKRRLCQDIYRLGRHVTINPLKIKKAAQDAWQAHLDYQRLMAEDALMSPQAISRMCGEQPWDADQAMSGRTIGVIGHPYLVYDELVNHRLIPRLQQSGVKVLTPEMLPGEALDAGTRTLVERPYWTYENEVLGAGACFLNMKLDGIIGVMAFSCGPDSLMMDMVRREAARRKSPFMVLTLEEHTAEAGLVTRLEAFLDMLDRKERRKQGICV